MSVLSPKTLILPVRVLWAHARVARAVVISHSVKTDSEHLATAEKPRVGTSGAAEAAEMQVYWMGKSGRQRGLGRLRRSHRLGRRT